MNVGFRTLIAAQALGDWQSHVKRHHRGVRVHLHGAIDTALEAVEAAVENALAAGVK